MCVVLEPSDIEQLVNKSRNLFVYSLLRQLLLLGAHVLDPLCG